MKTILIWTLTVIGMFSGVAMAEVPNVFDRAFIHQAMKRTAEWQHQNPFLWRHYEEYGERRILDWGYGPYVNGLVAAGQVTGDAAFFERVTQYGNAMKWDVFVCPWVANDHCTPQSWFELYELDPKPERIKPSLAALDIYMDRHAEMDETLEYKWKNRFKWSWCDALYMSPPAYARAAKVTGDKKYLDFLHTWWWRASDLYYHPEHHLYYRDQNAFEKMAPNGQPLFWCRGNGWVIGGLVRVLQYLEPDDPMRPKYEQQLAEMLKKLKTIQCDDGLWHSSLLAPTTPDQPATSGSAFILYGYAYAINEGLVSRDAYLPVVQKAWAALVSHLRDNGKFEGVQPIGHQPELFDSSYSAPYGTGAFMLAASEMYNLNLAYNRAADPHEFTVFMKDSGWCWFQDPRAVVQKDHLIMGSVRGYGDGSALIGSYDLKNNKRLGHFVAHESFDWDDHNSPVFYPRSDGSVLAVYARHHQEWVHYARLSTSPDFTQWGDEQVIDRRGVFLDGDKGVEKVTYSNLIPLASEDKLYNFYRGKEHNPSFMVSADEGKTWGGDAHFIQSDLDGVQRPYARYAGNGTDTVHVSFTDAHPHQYGNNLYYAAFRGDAFFKADGSQIKKISEGALMPAEAELVYRGSDRKSIKWGEHPPNAAWTSSMVFDEKGYPHIGYTVHLSPGDHRFRVATWNGAEWIDREVAFAGTCLYSSQSSYTGLITLDPKDPSYVLISTDVNPQTGQPLSGMYEIYSARIRWHSDVESIQWKPITKKSPVQNLRPMVVYNGEERIILWNRGKYTSFRCYDMDLIGMRQPGLYSGRDGEE